MRPRSLFVLVALGAAAGAYWARRNPSACPYALRFFVEGPHPGIGRSRLMEILEPRPGERILELGPGTGYYSLSVAASLDGGSLEVLDVQQEMLDHTMREAAENGVANIVSTCADARSLPYETDSFDGAFLVTVLGEIPDQGLALRELARVIKPGGRLVVGETMLDPHVVTPGKLLGQAQSAGLEFERQVGTPLAYFARFRRSAP
jgi:ubiquinone/menaquinone biosynthesis C-methylase UbiE